MTLTTESVATVLELELTPVIERWMKRVAKVPALTKINLGFQTRTGHLPRLLEDLITRLRVGRKAEGSETASAHDHGKARFEQGYSIPMLIEESRLLQLSIFDTLHMNRKNLDPDRLMLDVVIIANECDSQLKHTVETFVELQKHTKRVAV
jgi:hypothetical protein